MRRSVYSHNGESYIILDQVATHHFSKSYEEQPDMKYVNLYMKWCGADHVLKNQTHFLFCETIEEVEFEEINKPKTDVSNKAE